ncbi:MAG TPA: amidase [Gemmatimonadota bacterium]|nr:amidase [Gemmatimonadota bacterium]
MAEGGRAARLGLALGLVALSACGGRPQGAGDSAAGGEGPPITAGRARSAAEVEGLRFTDPELEQMLQPASLFRGLPGRREEYRAVRDQRPGNGTPPALLFTPWPPAHEPADRAPRWGPAPRIRRPDDLEQLAYAPLPVLSELVRTRRVTSVELTRMFLDRLRRYDSLVHAVVTLTTDTAMAQARRADREIAAGRWRGPLHGIPYGLKDLFDYPGYPTTWGAAPYRERRVDSMATVARRLEDAGAVLVAKTTLGALAWGDVWFGGQTRNPWNLEQGSSGSSAGSAATVSAGLVPFAIGTETLGSVLSPSARTGITGLRPSFGRVSRHGGMVVSWSMDKVGVLCHHAEDCAMVFDAMRGPDGRDPTVVDRPFPYRPRTDLSGARIGYVKAAFEADTGADGRTDRAVLDVLRSLGATLVPIELPDRSVSSLEYILAAEAAAAHDTLTRTDLDSLLVRQQAAAWPNVFRTARLVPATEYIQANQVRRLLGRDMRDLMEDLDAYVVPPGLSSNLLLTNLTGQPAMAVPDGFSDPDAPRSVTFVGPMYGEAGLLEIVGAYQAATEWDDAHPERFTPHP